MSFQASLLFAIEIRLIGLLESEYSKRDLKLLQWDCAVALISGEYIV
jgi:hypothetical protein